MFNIKDIRRIKGIGWIATGITLIVANAATPVLAGIDKAVQNSGVYGVYSAVQDSTGWYLVGDNDQYRIVFDSNGNDVGVIPTDYRPKLSPLTQAVREAFRLIDQNIAGRRSNNAPGGVRRSEVEFEYGGSTYKIETVNFDEQLSPEGGLQPVPRNDRIYLSERGDNEHCVIQDACLNGVIDAISWDENGICPPRWVKHESFWKEAGWKMGDILYIIRTHGARQTHNLTKLKLPYREH